MSANGSAVPQGTNEVTGKGKGKQAEDPQQYDMMDDEESESEASGPELEEAPEEPDEDNMEEIDESNIIYSGRTRGKQIDWAEAEAKSKEAGDDLDDEDDDEDDDFEDPDDEDRMQE